MDGPLSRTGTCLGCRLGHSACFLTDPDAAFCVTVMERVVMFVLANTPSALPQTPGLRAWNAGRSPREAA